MNKLLFSFFKNKKEPLIHKGSKLLLIATLFSDTSSLTSTFTDLRLCFFNISYTSRTTIIIGFLLISRFSICTVISVITQFKPTIRLPVERTRHLKRSAGLFTMDILYKFKFYFSTLIFLVV